MSREVSCMTCKYAHWAERVPNCPDCKRFSKWKRRETRIEPKPIYLGHRKGDNYGE